MIATLRREAMAARLAWLAPFLVLALLTALHRLPFGHSLETGPIAALLVLVTVHYLGAVPFGHEFDHGTLTLCLLQPRRRIVMWAEKVLAGAIVVGGFLLLARPLMALAGQPMDWNMTGFLALNAICAGPLMVQLTRSTAGGAGLALLGSILELVAIAVGPALLYRSLREPDSFNANPLLLRLYGAACLGGSALLWLRHQDRRSPRFWIQPHAWTRAGLLPSTRMHPRQPLGNLWRREWMLQRGNALTTAALCIILLGLWMGLAFWFPDDIRVTLLTPLVTPILFFMLLLVIPCLCGVAAGADRQLGTVFLSLALPASRRSQMRIRLLAGLALSLIAGSVPLVFCLLDPGRGSSWNSFLPEQSPILCLCVSAGGFAMGWLASHTIRSSLAALVASVVGVLFVVLGWYEAADWLSPLLAFTQVPWTWDAASLYDTLKNGLRPTLMLTVPPVVYVGMLLHRAVAEGIRCHSQRRPVAGFFVVATLSLWVLNTVLTAALLPPLNLPVSRRPTASVEQLHPAHQDGMSAKEHALAAE